MDTSGTDPGRRWPSQDLEGDAIAPSCRSRAATRLGTAVAIGTAGYLAWLVVGPVGTLTTRDLIGFTALLMGCTALVILRGVTVEQDRGAWLLLGIGLAIWTLADAWYTAVVAPQMQPFPTAADVGYLVFFPFAYTAVGLLVVRRVGAKAVGVWLDGLLVALAAGAFLSLGAPAITQELPESTWSVFLGFATPVSDLLLVSGLAGVVGLLGRRAGSMWWSLFAAAAVLWATDSLWLIGVMADDYRVGTVLDVGWLLAFALFAAAAWRPARLGVEVTEHAWSAVSVVAAAASFCLLIYGTQTRLPLLSVALAAGAVVIGVWRGGQMLKDASAYRQARVQAHRDELTGVANRRALTAELGHGDVPPGVLLLVDVDGFKQINDSLGHAAGDQVLRAVALRIRDAVGPTDMVARIGGDEFVVFRSASDEPPAATAERLRDVSAKPLAVSGLGIRVDISVGVALAPRHGRTLEALLKAADTAMYHAKRSRTGCCVYQPEWEADGSDQLRCIQDLRVALDDDRLACVYQPKIDLRSGQVVGVEALLRWHHPELGDVPPAWFLPLVERTALIRPLTLHVLDLALAQSARWRCGGRDWTVSVNLSATNLLDPSLPQEMARLLARHAVPPDRLMVEVTESVFVGDAERAAQVIGDLTRLGVRLSVDDYGTGFSALHRVRTVATEELKLDSSFIHGAAHRPDLQTIVRATALLAHGLDLVLVAEGIENEEDLAVVTELGCDLGQGFHLCPPLPAAELDQWLSRRAPVPPQRQVDLLRSPTA